MTLLASLFILSSLSSIALSINCISTSGAGCTPSDATANGHSCSTGAVPDIMLSISTHLSVDVGIGWDVEKAWLKRIIGAGLTVGGGFGVQTFGGDDFSVSGIVPTYEIYPITSPIDAGSMDDMENVLDSISFTVQSGSLKVGDYGNDVRAAMEDMITAMDARPSANQKIHVLVVNADPKSGGKGTTASLADLSDPCIAAVEAKKKGIRTYVLAVGENTVDYRREFFECLVSDTTNDIIEVPIASPNSVYSDILDKLCVNEYQFQITEMKLTSSDHTLITGSPPNTGRFVEGYNFGEAIPSGSLTLTVDIDSGTNDQIIPQGSYFTFYHAADFTASSGVVIPFTFSSDYTSNWGVQLSTASTTNSVGYVANIISDINDGFSMELRGLSMNNQYSANWRQSCLVGGSPGVSNIGDETETSGVWRCDQEDDQCDGITVSSTDPCAINGASGTAACNLNGASCGTSGFCNICDGCGSGFFGDSSSCVPFFDVDLNCKAYVIKEIVEGTLQSPMVIVWDRPQYEGNLVYEIKYDSATNGLKYSAGNVGSLNAFATLDWDKPYSSSQDYATITAKIINNDDVTTYSIVSTSTCSADTLAPTKEPTTSPTREPTTDPTTNPTPAPTFQRCGVFLYGWCGVPRCDCFGSTDRWCCFNTPNGIDYCQLDDPEYTLITLDSEDDGDDEESVTTATISVGIYPDGWGVNTKVVYELFEYGTVNKSIFLDEFTTTDEPDDTTTTTTTTSPMLTTITTAAGTIITTIPNVFPSGGFGTSSQEYVNQTENILQVQLTPIGIGTAWLNSTSSGDALAADITFDIVQSDIVCEQDDFNCLTQDKCESYAAYYELIIKNCSSLEYLNSTQCDVIHPASVVLLVERGNCDTLFATGKSGGVPDWLWWVLLALLIFLIILAWLVYRFWWKQKKSAGELGDAEDELDQQIADNQGGFGADLDTGDVKFNPMATGVPGMNRPADAFGNEIHKRQEQAQNDMVNVDAEVFQVRQDFGQVHGNTHDTNYSDQNQY